MSTSSNVEPSYPISTIASLWSAAAAHAVTIPKNQDLVSQLRLANLAYEAYRLESRAYMMWPLIRAFALDTVAMTQKKYLEAHVEEKLEAMAADLAAFHDFETGLRQLDRYIMRIEVVAVGPPYADYVNSAIAEMELDEDNEETQKDLQTSIAFSNHVPKRFDILRRWNPDGYASLVEGLEATEKLFLSFDSNDE